jgi:pyridoxal phosphate enzyme (YggS family)
MIDRIKANLAGIRNRIELAAQQSGRTSADVTLVAVTKYVDAPVARILYQAGCHELGESRPQALWEKSAALSDCNIHWHMIGHLQRNKVKRTLACARLIHSVDSLRLIEAIEEAAVQPVPVLLEINVSNEPAKHGFRPGELATALETVAAKQNVEVRGMMCMAGLEGDLDEARREFALLRELRDKHRQFDGPNIRLNELSMGMSGDFEVAIQEGATLVRIGSSLFEGI